MIMKSPAVAVAGLIFMGCMPIAQSDGDIVPSDSPQSNPCTLAHPTRRVEIKIGENQMASICRADGVGDCLYTHALGKTFVQERPDLNMDKREDFLIKDFSGAYGMHDVVHFMGFVSCPGDFYVRVLDDFLTNVRVKHEKSAEQWRQLQAERACFDENRGDIVMREYTIAFDQALSLYGPPDGDPALAEFCSTSELALPVN